VKGLEACEDILTNEPLIEYVGRVMLRDQYDKDNLFYHRYPTDFALHF